MKEYFFPRAYQERRSHTCTLTRVLQSLPDAAAQEALDSINWLEPVGHLDHLWGDEQRVEGTTGWVHPLTAVLWTHRPALIMAAIEKASRSLESAGAYQVGIKVNHTTMFMNNWVGENVVHQAVQYSSPEVIRHLLGHLSVHRDNQSYLPSAGQDKDLWASVGLYGRRDRPAAEWQTIIKLLDRYTEEHASFQVVGKDAPRRMSAYEKQRRQLQHTQLYLKALEGGNWPLAQAVQGLKQVKTPLYKALNSALDRENAGVAWKVLQSPVSTVRLDSPYDTEDQQTRFSRNLGRIASEWANSIPKVDPPFEVLEVQEQELAAVRALTVFLAQDMARFPLLESHLSTSNKPSQKKHPPQLASEDRPVSPEKDLPLLMAPALALLNEEEVHAIGVAWTRWPGDNEPALQGLPTLEEWNALPDCAWRDLRAEAIHEALEQPERRGVYLAQLRNDVARLRIDWASSKGAQTCELIQTLFARESAPMAAAEQWWESHDLAQSLQGTPEDNARRQAWLGIFLPKPTRSASPLRF